MAEWATGSSLPLQQLWWMRRWPLPTLSLIIPTGMAKPRKRSSVRFVEDSPMLTPSWKSAAWNKKPASNSAGPGSASPELRPSGDSAVPGDAEWEHAEAQADRDWCALTTCPHSDMWDVLSCYPALSSPSLVQMVSCWKDVMCSTLAMQV